MKVKIINNHSFFTSFISIAFIIISWSLLNYLKLINPIFLPSPVQTFQALIIFITKPSFCFDIFITLYRALCGLLLSIIIGVPLGLILGRISWLYKLFEIPIEFFRAIPSSALFPLFILFLGIGDCSKIGVVFYGSSLIMIINSYYGALPTKEKQDRINMLRSFGANSYQIFKLAILRDAIPNISAGIRVCISLSYVLVVVTEMFLGTNRGLGKLLYDLCLQYKIPEMYAVIITLGFIGFLSNQLYVLLEKKVIFWFKR